MHHASDCMRALVSFGLTLVPFSQSAQQAPENAIRCCASPLVQCHGKGALS